MIFRKGTSYTAPFKPDYVISSIGTAQREIHYPFYHVKWWAIALHWKGADYESWWWIEDEGKESNNDKAKDLQNWNCCLRKLGARWKPDGLRRLPNQLLTTHRHIKAADLKMWKVCQGDKVKNVKADLVEEVCHSLPFCFSHTASRFAHCLKWSLGHGPKHCINCETALGR